MQKKKKKQKIQIAGNPNYYSLPKPNRLINHPGTGTPSFGNFPAINLQENSFAAGPIYLREGLHRGDGNGFGFNHIWREHFSDVLDATNAESTVVAFVAAILVSGSSIHYEGGVGALTKRTMVLGHANGVAILEERLDGSNNVFYSVVTAYASGSPHGRLVGTL